MSISPGPLEGGRLYSPIDKPPPERRVCKDETNSPLPPEVVTKIGLLKIFATKIQDLIVNWLNNLSLWP